MSTAQMLSQHVEKHLSSGVTDLTLDLTDIAFMDSSGLRLLIELNHRSQQQAWRLRLTPPKHEGATLVLRATGADTRLPFAQSMGR